MFKLFLPILLFFLFIFSASSVLAVSDPRLSSNNKVGINSLSPEAEIAETASMVNNNGDWGYVLVTIRKSERDLKRWQDFMNQARKYHLIPIVRIATDFNEKGSWQKPVENDAREWAEFLSKLYFPTKNKYVQIYNEVNRSTEWGGEVNPSSYALELDKTIKFLKEKDENFFILNAPLDLALSTSESTIEAEEFFRRMNEAVPGIFEKIDGLSSHSYPNPDFSSPPSFSARIGIDGYKWEINELGKYSSKDFPVFITETGWKRITSDQNGLTEEEIAKYYQEAFDKVWHDPKVVAVAPFVLGYPQSLFDEFSFKTAGVSEKKYFKYFYTIRDLKKNRGNPVRDNLLSDLIIQAPAALIKDKTYDITIRFKNSGNLIWNYKENLGVNIVSNHIQIESVYWNKEEFNPGDEALVIIKVKGTERGNSPVRVQISSGDKVLSQKEFFARVEDSFSITILKIRNFVTEIFA